MISYASVGIDRSQSTPTYGLLARNKHDTMCHMTSHVGIYLPTWLQVVYMAYTTVLQVYMPYILPAVPLKFHMIMVYYNIYRYRKLQ